MVRCFDCGALWISNGRCPHGTVAELRAKFFAEMDAFIVRSAIVRATAATFRGAR